METVVGIFVGDISSGSRWGLAGSQFDFQVFYRVRQLSQWVGVEFKRLSNSFPGNELRFGGDAGIISLFSQPGSKAGWPSIIDFRIFLQSWPAVHIAVYILIALILGNQIDPQNKHFLNFKYNSFFG